MKHIVLGCSLLGGWGAVFGCCFGIALQGFTHCWLKEAFVIGTAHPLWLHGLVWSVSFHWPTARCCACDVGDMVGPRIELLLHPCCWGNQWINASERQRRRPWMGYLPQHPSPCTTQLACILPFLSQNASRLAHFIVVGCNWSNHEMHPRVDPHRLPMHLTLPTDPWINP